MAEMRERWFMDVLAIPKLPGFKLQFCCLYGAGILIVVPGSRVT